MFLNIYLWLSFLLLRGIHLFPITSSPSLLMSLSVTSPSLLLPRFLSVYLVPWGRVVLFFCRSSGRKAKESPRQPSVYKAFCHVNKDKLFLSLTSQIPNSNIDVHLFTWRPVCSATITVLCRLICVYTFRCVCVRERGVYVCGWVVGLAKSSCFLPGNNWFNKLPAMFHSKEVTGAKRGDGARRLIRKQSHLYGN